MLILRKPPYPISISYKVPAAESYYYLVIEDMEDQRETETYILSNAASEVVYELDGEFVRYDKSYSVKIFESHITSDGHERGDIVVEDNLDVSRPYVYPESLGTTATEIKEYTKHESLARAIIDSITGGFYYKKTYLETTGQGTDYIPLWKKTHKILKAYENTELVYDSSEDDPSIGEFNYFITKDQTAIIKDSSAAYTAFNRSQRKPATLPFGASDSFGLNTGADSSNFQSLTAGVLFNSESDYIFILETGYMVVPYDIQDATTMLIDDIKCGRLDYYTRYVKNYKTDQFQIEYDARMIQGTGNILVDKILSRYVSSIIKPGVL